VSQRLLWPGLTDEERAAGWGDQAGPAMTTGDVLDALERRHADHGKPAGYDEGWSARPGRWAFLREVQAAAGEYSEVQRIDGLAIGLVPSVRFARVAYEVKVSRADWLREARPRWTVWRVRGVRSHWAERMAATEEGRAQLRAEGWTVEPARKWDPMLALANEVWFAAPPRVIQPGEVPEGCGLIEVRPWGRDGLRARAAVTAAWRDTPHPGPAFWGSVLRALSDRRWRGAYDRLCEALDDEVTAQITGGPWESGEVALVARHLARALNGPRWGEVEPDEHDD
jgi:hypothetical protein